MTNMNDRASVFQLEKSIKGRPDSSRGLAMIDEITEALPDPKANAIDWGIMSTVLPASGIRLKTASARLALRITISIPFRIQFRIRCVLPDLRIIARKDTADIVFA